MSAQVFAYALQLTGEITQQRKVLLEALCSASAAALSARLREGMIPEDCEDAFIPAAALMALAALAGIATDTPTEQITAGDFTIRKGSVSYDAASAALRVQAEQIMMPYLMDRFSFQGV